MLWRCIILIMCFLHSLYGLSDHEIKERIEGYAKNYLKQNNATGLAIAVIKNNFEMEEPYQKTFCFGFSNRAQKSPIRESTLFRLGSLSKTFTALLIASLAEDNKVDINKPASEYLPKTFALPFYHETTFKLSDLLMNISSLPNMPTIPMRDYQVSWVEVENYFRKYKLSKKPGTKYEISDLGYALLGHIAARVERVSYEKVLSERVLIPLHLDSTYYSLPFSKMGLLATGYRALTAIGEHLLDREGCFFKPSRGLVSNIKDMKTWLALFLKMSSSSLEACVKHVYKMSYTHPDGRKKECPGWRVEPLSMEKPLIMYHEEGIYQGFSHSMAFIPDTKTGVVILSNSEYDVKPLAIAILHLLHE